jgi:hypothetical protein
MLTGLPAQFGISYCRDIISLMWTYEQIKNWTKEKENKQKMVYGICFVLVFIIGFGTGRFDSQYQISKLKSYVNYTTSAPKNAAGDKPAASIQQVKSTTTSTPNCIVKGNINSKGFKIYHIKGGAFYNLVKPEQCFNTEAEAVAAGFVKSSR